MIYSQEFANLNLQNQIKREGKRTEFASTHSSVNPSQFNTEVFKIEASITHKPLVIQDSNVSQSTEFNSVEDGKK